MFTAQPRRSAIIIFKFGPVADRIQDPDSGFWPGHQVGRINPYFLKKIQNGVVLVKKPKINEL